VEYLVSGLTVKIVFQFCSKNTTFYFVMLRKLGLFRWSISTLFSCIF